MDVVELQNGLRISTPMHNTLYQGALGKPTTQNVREYIERHLLECQCTGSLSVVPASMEVAPPSPPFLVFRLGYCYYYYYAGRLITPNHI